MANMNDSGISCKRLGFCHHRQTSPPSDFLSDGGDIQSDSVDTNLPVILKGG